MNILFSCNMDEENKENFLKELKLKFVNIDYIENYFPNKNERTILFKMIRGLRRKYQKSYFINLLYDKQCRKYYSKLLKSNKIKYDFFLTIAREFSPEFIKTLKEYNPNVKTILYLWDKIDYTSFNNNYEHFDYIFTFDRVDSKEKSFKFRPTFYLDYFRDNLKDYSSRNYDLYYIGQVREDKRIKIIEKFYNTFSKENLNIFIKLFKDRKNKNVKINNNILLSQKISYKENIEILKNSKVVIDISYKNQTGLTLRCFEALATETKIITDNKDILNYDFYNPNNIIYIEKIDDIEKIPLSFFSIPYEKVEEKILNRYSVKGFLDEIFNIIQNI